MKLINGALVREQNESDVDDSCFDTSECEHMLQKIMPNTADLIKLHCELNLDQFIVNGQLERHPQTKFPNDVSSDQAHMYCLATKRWQYSVTANYKTPNGDPVSVGFYAEFKNLNWLKNLSLIFQIILFWLPIRWCDGENPTTRIGPIRLNIGYRHHCGDYRLFKQCLYYAPWYIRRLVCKKSLKNMTRLYWAPEPNSEWLIEIDDRFIDECL